MGNSLLDVVVFGRVAGTAAAKAAESATPGKLTLQHVKNFEKERADAGITTATVSPKLLPHYTHRDGNL
jgi:succinate dehydrogenase / fumarate reductase flavoprotein subunit